MHLKHRALMIGLAAALCITASTPAPALAQNLSSLGSLSGLLNLLVGLAPPALPQYNQPPAPGPNQIWQPGYWASGPSGYFWVPGTWVNPPQPGLLWTPGYWAANQSGQYQFNPGYWAQNVGYYGGVNYGDGYNGEGYTGGRWNGHTFYYNTAITNVNRTVVRYIYSEREAGPYNDSRVSYNGGPHGIHLRPDQHQLAWARERHYAMTSAQQEHVRVAAADRNYLEVVNHGRPQAASVGRPLGPNNHPMGFAPVRASDRAHAMHQAPPQHAMRQAPQHHAMRQAPQQHAMRQAPQQHAMRQAPQQHAMRQAPQQHAGHASNPKGGEHQPHPHATPQGHGR